ncbi:MAG TPA: hypothetical protein VK633_00930 [Verrucomicrobiae bacterium]|nr:hypothetical protein [Verrucomicrobiae bacterium]
MQTARTSGLLLCIAALTFLGAQRVTAAATVVSPRPYLAAAYKAKTFDDFVAAIHLHETDGRVGPIYGDGGRSYGPLQISYAAWRDARRFDRSISAKYSDCKDLETSKKVMLAYLLKHDGQAFQRGDWETCARLWNSGPAWRTKMMLTNIYWASVRGYLARGNS